MELDPGEIRAWPRARVGMRKSGKGEEEEREAEREERRRGKEKGREERNPQIISRGLASSLQQVEISHAVIKKLVEGALN